MAKPFLKWAGGKTQLINEIDNILPKHVIDKEFTYIEPFVGSGAFLFWMLENYPNLKRAIINDANEDLMITYQVIADEPEALIDILDTFQVEYHSLDDDLDKKKEYYYDKRNIYNTRKESKVMRAALFIFLNRTCFNGLYRVNRKNQFNVPIGSYKKPRISDKDNILAVSEALQKVVILSGDYEETLKYVDDNTLFYFDPPYKPLSNTSSFNSYAKDEFDDDEQIRLRDFCRKIDSIEHTWILSNSDVKNGSGGDDFFDVLYDDFVIYRVEAKRRINANPSKRGKLTELLITNHKNNE